MYEESLNIKIYQAFKKEIKNTTIFRKPKIIHQFNKKIKKKY